MDVDWIVAIGVFLVFAVWAFAFYAQLFVAPDESPEEAVDDLADRILANLTVKVHAVPVRANISNESLSNRVLFFQHRWPFGLNTTKVLKNGVAQACTISEEIVYWRSNLDPNVNYFTFRYSEQEASLFCTDSFSLANRTQVVPFAIEEQEQISRARMLHMNSTNYSAFKASLGITRDFNVTIQNETVVLLSYGIPSPRATNVFSKTILRELEETGETITIRLLVW